MSCRLIETECAASALPCVLVDLRPVFADHLTEYTDASGILPNDLGSEAIAGAIWERMRLKCVAR